ncbi:MAG: NAD(+)/NADH kinase [bacterium]
MKCIGLMANDQKPRAAEALARLCDHASALGFTLLADEKTRRLRGADPTVGALDAASLAAVEAIVVLGGDGTMLRAVRALHGLDVPLMGVNVGGLGFMTSVAEADLERALDCLRQDAFTISIRTVLDIVAHRGGETLAVFRALNEVALNTGTLRVITLSVQVDGDPMGEITGDGLIVATPTGSTGHSLSAGGPVLTPTATALTITGICPHAMSARPLVVPDCSVIRVTVSCADGDVICTADGQVSHPLRTGDEVVVNKSAQSVRFLHLPGYSWFGVLRQKLHWRGSVMGQEPEARSQKP